MIGDRRYFHSPFFIFIKGINHLSDEQIFQLLGLNNCKERNYEEKTDYYFRITKCNEWIHIMDNCWCNLWYSDCFKNRIDKLGEKYDVFYCSVGDSDDSFDFTYYENGKLRRKYAISDCFTHLEVIENIGLLLPFEEENLKKSGELEKVISIAESIGIEINHKLENIICYQYEKHFDAYEY